MVSIIQEKCFKFKFLSKKCGGLLVVGSLLKKNLVPYRKRIKTFLGLYTKAPLWACKRLEKRGCLTRKRNGLKA